MPENASLRMTAAATGNAIYKYRDALQNLDYLYDKRQINFPDRLLLAQYCIHAGQFDKAKKILEEAQNIHPYTVPQISDLSGRLNMLSHQWKEAVASYQKYLSLIPDNKFTLYSIARIYALSGNKTEAMKWLKTAIDKGFKYYWVLHSDTSWNEFQTLPAWKTLVATIPVTSYQSSFK